MRKVRLMLLLMLVIMTLTGCVAQVVETSINADGSGTVYVRMGLTKESIESLGNIDTAEGIEKTQIKDISELQSFTYNGTTYYGSIESADFDNLSVLNNTLSNVPDGQEYGPMSIRLASDGRLSLALDGRYTDEMASIPSMEEVAVDEGGMTKEQYAEYAQSFVAIYKFIFPGAVTQVSGDNLGVEVSGNTVTLDLVKMSNTTSNDTYYLFTTLPNTTQEVKPTNPTKSKFVDVPDGAWYTSAVTTLAEGGLVAGVGNNKFDPASTMTYSQFCQILARADGGLVGEENGYWAYKAINHCINKAYINSLGVITPSNYDIPITREVAISALYIAKGGSSTSTKNISITDIPDHASIDESLRNFIVGAYNQGITSGIDNTGKFNPKGKLTRAEVCQLFYNLGWIQPAS